MLRETQRDQYNGNDLTLILPSLTQWTSHYLAATRLLDLGNAIRILVLTSRGQLIEAEGNEADAIRKANEIMNLISQPIIWENLKI